MFFSIIAIAILSGVAIAVMGRRYRTRHPNAPKISQRRQEAAKILDASECFFVVGDVGADVEVLLCGDETALSSILADALYRQPCFSSMVETAIKRAYDRPL